MAAQKAGANDKTKWASGHKQSKAHKLSGRKNWSFLYQCMTATRNDVLMATVWARDGRLKFDHKSLLLARRRVACVP